MTIETQGKPNCQLTGEDGNVFGLVGKVSKTLKRAGQPDKAKEMADRVCKSGSYAEAIAIMGEYVEIS
jgi:hypothetical protein